MKTTEDLRREVIAVQSDLRAGKISAPVARSLLAGYKIALDSLRIEMDAARLGAPFGAVALDEATRNKPVPATH